MHSGNGFFDSKDEPALSEVVGKGEVRGNPCCCGIPYNAPATHRLLLAKEQTAKALHWRLNMCVLSYCLPVLGSEMSGFFKSRDGQIQNILQGNDILQISIWNNPALPHMARSLNDMSVSIIGTEQVPSGDMRSFKGVGLRNK